MKSVSARINIKASPEVIWRILTDAAHYPEWDPSTVRIKGTIADGQMITVYTNLSKRIYPTKVTNFQPNKSMQWIGGVSPVLAKSVRTFTLDPKKDGSVDFSVDEEFSGLFFVLMRVTLTFLMRFMLPDMTKPFQDFVAGLKARAEASAK